MDTGPGDGHLKTERDELVLFKGLLERRWLFGYDDIQLLASGYQRRQSAYHAINVHVGVTRKGYRFAWLTGNGTLVAQKRG